MRKHLCLIILNSLALLCSLNAQDIPTILQAEDAAFKIKRHKKQKRKARHPITPMYDQKDVEKTVKLFRPVEYFLFL